MRKIAYWCCICVAMLFSCAVGFAVGRTSATQVAEPSISASNVVEENHIQNFRTERQQLRQMQLSQLNEIIHSDRPDTQIIALAQQRQLELMEWSEQELTLEGVLEMRGFADNVVTVHTDSVNVIINAETVSKQDASIIFDLVTRETGISSGNVKIIPVK